MNDPTQDNGIPHAPAADLPEASSIPADLEPAPPPSEPGARLRLHSAAGGVVPVGDEVLIESMHPGVLTKMRELNNAVGALQERAREIFDAYICARGWSPAKQEIELNFASGQITVKARPTNPS